MKRNFLIICFIFFLLSCKENRVTVSGVVTVVEYQHIGRNKYKQVVTFNYSYNGYTYNNTESNLFHWQGAYKMGDSVNVALNSSKPSQAKITGKVEKPERLKSIKLRIKK